MKKMLAILYALFAVLACGINEPVVNKYELTIPKEELSFPSAGGSSIAYAVCEGPLTFSVDQAWCTVTEEASTSSKTHKFTVSVSENTQTEDREAAITISTEGASAKMTINQDSADGFVLKTKEVDQIPTEGGSISIFVSSNVDYTVSVDGTWLTEDAKTKASMQDGTHTFTASENVGLERTATVSFVYGDIKESVTVSQAPAAVKPIASSAPEIAAKMYPGWNLGNTMEAIGNGLGAETSWQGTPTTQKLMSLVKGSGFNSVRIPCSWDIHSDADGKIDPVWMNRVREIVDYCIAEGLYVMLNDHWDNGWIEVLGFSKSSSRFEAVDDATIAQKSARLKNIWTQIATYFKDYDEHLLFAGLNEPFQQYDLFSTRHKELTPILEKYNQAFVDAVRATGGNNSNRILVVQGPSTNIASTYSYFHIPADSVENALMVEVHYYDPYDFCFGDQSKLYYGAANHVSGSPFNCTYGEDDFLKEQFEKMYTKFSSKGVPVIIGEYAADTKIVPPGENLAKHKASIRLFYKTVNKVATDCGLIAFAWDVNNITTTGSTGSIIKRQDCTIFNQEVLDSIMEGVREGSWPM